MRAVASELLAMSLSGHRTRFVFAGYNITNATDQVEPMRKRIQRQVGTIVPRRLPPAQRLSLRPHEVLTVTKISSGQTWFYKRVFPAIWFGFLAVFTVRSALGGTAGLDAMFIVIPVAMAVFGFFLMRKLVWDLLDEVYDCGDSLLVRNRGEEDSISLSIVMNISASTNTNPPRVTLRLETPSKFGSEVAFSPIGQFTLNPFAKNKIAEDLMVRVDQARSRRNV